MTDNLQLRVSQLVDILNLFCTPTFFLAPFSAFCQEHFKQVFYILLTRKDLIKYLYFMPNTIIGNLEYPIIRRTYLLTS